MPLYEYECESCNHRFEVIQKFSDSPIEKCPKCGGGVRKLVSSPAFHLKGSGWYATDYARKNEGSKSDGKSGASETAKEGSGSQESKDKPAQKDSTGSSEPASAPKPPAKTSTNKPE